MTTVERRVKGKKLKKNEKNALIAKRALAVIAAMDEA